MRSRFARIYVCDIATPVMHKVVHTGTLGAVPLIELVTYIHAPRERVFDLSRSVDAHAQSQTKYQERVVAGRLSGMMELGESVTWEAVHLGVKQRLASRIVAMERPSYFRDAMVTGAFARFDHDHYFEEADGVTTMRDVFDYDSPLGIWGASQTAYF